jgi:hypothetical protein
MAVPWRGSIAFDRRFRPRILKNIEGPHVIIAFAFGTLSRKSSVSIYEAGDSTESMVQRHSM